MIYKIKNILVCFALFFSTTLLIMLNIAVYKSLKETFFENKVEKPIEVTIKGVRE